MKLPIVSGSRVNMRSVSTKVGTVVSIITDDNTKSCSVKWDNVLRLEKLLVRQLKLCDETKKKKLVKGQYEALRSNIERSSIRSNEERIEDKKLYFEEIDKINHNIDVKKTRPSPVVIGDERYVKLHGKYTPDIPPGTSIVLEDRPVDDIPFDSSKFETFPINIDALKYEVSLRYFK
jgi:hypothetical protein